MESLVLDMKLHDLTGWLKRHSMFVVKYLHYGVIGTMKLHDLTGWLKECIYLIKVATVWKLFGFGTHVSNYILSSSIAILDIYNCRVIQMALFNILSCSPVFIPVCFQSDPGSQFSLV